DEVSMYNRALSQTELQSIVNAGAAGRCLTSTPPSILTQPQNQVVSVGSSATFNVVANGSAPLAYQWRFNGTNIAGATGTSLLLSNVQPTQVGFYSVRLDNLVGFVLSSNALLTVNSGATGCVSSASGLVSWWRAEGNAGDASGGNVGSLSGVTFAPGEVGQGFSFHGGSNEVLVPASPSLNVGTSTNGMT